MLEALLKKYNHRRKEQFFQSPLFQTQKTYAFIGVGIHSLTNFYPLLRHFNIRLKYICTKGSDWSRQLSPLFPGCIFTHDLKDILHDKEVAGVFVCTDPDAHYSLLQTLLSANKNVFIEKPPCRDLSQLRQLLSLHPEGICKVGLQRRYWPGNRSIQKKCRQATSYTYQFQTGPFGRPPSGAGAFGGGTQRLAAGDAYPQGDPYTELFLHPLDYCRFLFGECRLQSFSRHQDSVGITLQLHVTHDNNCSGLVQLSTHHSWNPALERLCVNASKESLDIEYPGSVKGRPAPFRFLNLPTERVLRQPAVERQYFMGGPSLVPALEYNTLMVQGFYQEIETFVSLVEGFGKEGTRKDGSDNDLPSLLNTYEIMEKIRQGPAKA
jgi:virulence factor